MLILRVLGLALAFRVGRLQGVPGSFTRTWRR